MSTISSDETAAERIARLFHEIYEDKAPDYGYKTREASAKPWTEVPEQNKTLMVSVVRHLLERGDIYIGNDPLLGLATTKQLLDELITRVDVHIEGFRRDDLMSKLNSLTNRMTEEELHYRTVDAS